MLPCQRVLADVLGGSLVPCACVILRLGYEEFTAQLKDLHSVMFFEPLLSVWCAFIVDDGNM